MDPTEKALWDAITAQSLPLIKSLMPLFTEPQNHFKNVNEYPSLAYVNEEADKKSLFFHAIECGNFEVIYFLNDILPKEAKLLTSTSGQTPLALAAERGYTQLCRRLIVDGVKVNTLDRNAASPISLAARNGHASTVLVLAEAKADVNRQDRTGKTPLHYACQKGDPDTARYLLEAKALPFLRDNKGETPLTIAYSHQNSNLIFLLFTYGAAMNVSLPPMNEKLITTLNTLSSNYDHPIFMLSSKNSEALTKVTTKYENYTSITFAHPAQRYAIYQHCDKLLLEGISSESDLIEIARLKEKLEIPSLLQLTAQILRDINTKQKIENLFHKMKEKKRLDSIKEVNLPKELIEKTKLEVLRDLLIESGYLDKPAETEAIELAQTRHLAILPVTPTDVKLTTKKIVSSDVIPFMDSQKEIMNLNKMLEQLQQLEDALNNDSNNCCSVLKHFLKCGYYPFGFRIPLLFFLIMAVSIIYFVYLFAHIRDYVNEVIACILLVIFGFADLLGIAFLTLIPLLCSDNFAPVQPVTSQSRDLLIAFLKMIDSQLDSSDDSETSQFLGRIIAKLNIRSGNQPHRITTALSNVKSFFEAEQERISTDAESHKHRYRYLERVQFFPPVKDAIPTIELEPISSLGYAPVMTD